MNPSKRVHWPRLVYQLGLLFLVFGALISPAHAERLPLRTYTTADGLGHNVVNKIVHDSRGFVWFSTEAGLSRFDGYKFTNLSVLQGLPHPSVKDFLETREGIFWIATGAGLVRFDPRGSPANSSARGAAPMFTVVMPDSVNRYAKVITRLLEDRDGRIWCGTLDGLILLTKAGPAFVLKPVRSVWRLPLRRSRFINALLEDHFGTLWIGTANGPDADCR